MTCDLQNKIAAFLRGRRGLSFCTDCVREEFAYATIEGVICETESMKGQSLLEELAPEPFATTISTVLINPGPRQSCAC